LKQKNKFTIKTATAVVIANMIGTGVFTSLGFQLETIESGFPLIFLWVVGGCAAICGALCYAELGAALPRSGGEYNFLTKIYHPIAGFISGWISSTIGFSAPVALAAMTFGAYSSGIFTNAPVWLPKVMACILIVILTKIHTGRRDASGNFQTLFTILKISVIIGFCFIGLLFTSSPQPINFFPVLDDIGIISSGAFAVSLIYVSYAYTGWNAATYLSGEIENPQRDLPRILITGTVVVMILYVLINSVFLWVAPIDAMRGELEIGIIAAEAVFGRMGGQITGFILAILLISTVSAMTIAGPRVLQVIGEDTPTFSWLKKTNDDDIPTRAIYLQSGLALFFVITSTFDQVLIFAGFTLALNSFVTVLGLIILRFNQPNLPRPFRVKPYPLIPIIYLTLTLWVLIFVLVTRLVEVLFSIVLIILGLIFYFASQYYTRKSTQNEKHDG